jgi:polysaccharide export outer membrane protein
MQISLLMKIQNVPLLLRLNLFLASAVLVLGLAGCASDPSKVYKEEMEPPSLTGDSKLPPLVAGDEVTITLTGLPTDIAAMVKPISEDGTISLPDIGTVQAAGKTPAELEIYIHDQYVPKYYTHLNVTVKTTSDRVYYVRGEVHTPNRMIYTGPITVTKAITSAGDFTDFADHADVDLIRANGKHFKLNCDKILSGEAPDPPVFPGDLIVVHRRLL